MPDRSTVSNANRRQETRPLRPARIDDHQHQRLSHAPLTQVKSARERPPMHGANHPVTRKILCSWTPYRYWTITSHFRVSRGNPNEISISVAPFRSCIHDGTCRYSRLQSRRGPNPRPLLVRRPPRTRAISTRRKFNICTAGATRSRRAIRISKRTFSPSSTTGSDLGNVFGKPDKIFVGTEIQYWVNKYGIKDLTEFNPQTLLVWSL